MNLPGWLKALKPCEGCGVHRKGSAYVSRPWRLYGGFMVIDEVLWLCQRCTRERISEVAFA